mmetsp:Transcript_3837/g.5358  ORF Transcript_3837/g.5358 Transcript_3837/m.5358 type:complete len:205 (-) Transcript_3837:48-662(-)
MKNASRLTEYVNYIKRSATILIDEGKFSTAANAYREAADTLMQSGEYDKALELYKLAADLISIDDDSKINYITTLAKLAECYAWLEDYENAWMNFEKAAESQIARNSTMDNHIASDYFYKAGLCALCFDLITAKKAIEKYDTECSGFPSTVKGRLLHQVAEAYEGMNEASFMEAITLNQSTIDNFQTKLLLKIKKEIQAEDGLM